jgi:hypothetical protein
VVAVGQAHTPARHDCPVGQRVPQVPQLAGSELRFAQAAPQKVVPPGQPQTPPTHDCAPGHTLPQRPQLLRSALVFTHAVPQ